MYLAKVLFCMRILGRNVIVLEVLDMEMWEDSLLKGIGRRSSDIRVERNLLFGGFVRVLPGNACRVPELVAVCGLTGV